MNSVTDTTKGSPADTEECQTEEANKKTNSHMRMEEEEDMMYNTSLEVDGSGDGLMDLLDLMDGDDMPMPTPTTCATPTAVLPQEIRDTHSGIRYKPCWGTVSPATSSRPGVGGLQVVSNPHGAEAKVHDNPLVRFIMYEWPRVILKEKVYTDVEIINRRYSGREGSQNKATSGTRQEAVTMGVVTYKGYPNANKGGSNTSGIVRLWNTRGFSTVPHSDSPTNNITQHSKDYCLSSLLTGAAFQKHFLHLNVGDVVAVLDICTNSNSENNKNNNSNPLFIFKDPATLVVVGRALDVKPCGYQPSSGSNSGNAVNKPPCSILCNKSQRNPVRYHYCCYHSSKGSMKEYTQATRELKGFGGRSAATVSHISGTKRALNNVSVNMSGSNTAERRNIALDVGTGSLSRAPKQTPKSVCHSSSSQLRLQLEAQFAATTHQLECSNNMMNIQPPMSSSLTRPTSTTIKRPRTDDSANCIDSELASSDSTYSLCIEDNTTIYPLKMGGGVGAQESTSSAAVELVTKSMLLDLGSDDPRSIELSPRGRHRLSQMQQQVTSNQGYNSNVPSGGRLQTAVSDVGNSDKAHHKAPIIRGTLGKEESEFLLVSSTTRRMLTGAELASGTSGNNNLQSGFSMDLMGNKHASNHPNAVKLRRLRGEVGEPCDRIATQPLNRSLAFSRNCRNTTSEDETSLSLASNGSKPPPSTEPAIKMGGAPYTSRGNPPTPNNTLQSLNVTGRGRKVLAAAIQLQDKTRRDKALKDANAMVLIAARDRSNSTCSPIVPQSKPIFAPFQSVLSGANSQIGGISCSTSSQLMNVVSEESALSVAKRRALAGARGTPLSHLDSSPGAKDTDIVARAKAASSRNETLHIQQSEENTTNQLRKLARVEEALHALESVVEVPNVPCSHCRTCQRYYTNPNTIQSCSDKGHIIFGNQTATKRFYECSNCKQYRTAELVDPKRVRDLPPAHLMQRACPKCKNSPTHWRPTNAAPVATH